MRWFFWCCVISLLSACQPVLQRADNGASPVPEAPSSVSRLVDFSNRFEMLAERDQVALCDSMRLSLKPDAPGLSGWYLATAIARVEACGERAEAILLLRQLSAGAGLERDAAWLVRFQLEQLLKLEQGQAALQEERQVAHRKLQQAEQRARQLEKKLNELKRIETSINERLDEPQKTE